MYQSLAKETLSPYTGDPAALNFLECLLKTMDKTARLSIPEIGTTVSQWELSSLLPTSPLCSIQKQETQSFSFSILLQSLWGEQPLFHLFSLFLFPFLHLILSLLFFLFFPSFAYFERPNFQRVSLGATPQMKWHTVEKDREAFCCMAWNWIPMTSSARCNTSHSSAAVKSMAFDYTWWVCTVPSLSGGNQMKSLFHLIPRLIHIRDTNDYDCL